MNFCSSEPAGIVRGKLFGSVSVKYLEGCLKMLIWIVQTFINIITEVERIDTVVE